MILLGLDTSHSEGSLCLQRDSQILELLDWKQEKSHAELIAGFLDKSVNGKYPIAFNILNRRGEDANFTDWTDFKKAVSSAEKNKLPVYITFNGIYTEKQYKLITETIKKI